MPGCATPGEYRAPRSREALTEYFWFCLDHVRAYNASWDFYKGMSPAQIELQLRADSSWQRPSWPLGRLGAGYRLTEEALRDPLHAMGAGRADEPPRHQAPAELREPLATLGLHWPLTLEALRARYRDLAKQHHPDANNGDRAAEERLKIINLAYATLRGRLAGEPKLAATA
jgi:hypothetical protein